MSRRVAAVTFGLVSFLGEGSCRCGLPVVATTRGPEHPAGRGQGAPDHYMTHLSITEASGDGRPEADWGEHVTDDQCHTR